LKHNILQLYFSLSLATDFLRHVIFGYLVHIGIQHQQKQNRCQQPTNKKITVRRTTWLKQKKKYQSLLRPVVSMGPVREVSTERTTRSRVSLANFKTTRASRSTKRKYFVKT